jgi:hypothetical protein
MPDEPASAPLQVNVLPTIADDPQCVALAKGVNDTLNAYISITDSKAVAFLGGATAAASFFLSRPVEGLVFTICYIASAAAYVTGAVNAASVIFPRVPACGRGVVFWGDIASRESADDYAAAFDRRCSEGGLLADYAWLNFCTSQILRRKVRRLRIAMALCLTALAISVPAFILSRQ